MALIWVHLEKIIYLGLNRRASEVHLLLLCDFPVLLQQHWSLDLWRPENTTTRRCQTRFQLNETISWNKAVLARCMSSWFSPCVCCPWCGQGVQTRVRATIFSPSKEALRWLNSTRKELLSWARGKSSSSLWPPSSSSTVWLLLETTWWFRGRLKTILLLIIIFSFPVL